MPILEVDPRIHGVAQAEKSLAAGHYAAAAGSIIRMMPHIRSLSPASHTLSGRAQRVLAVAIARSQGSLAVELEIPREIYGTWLGKSVTDRDQNLSFAAVALRKQVQEKKDDPALLTDLAEVLAKRDATRTEARTILEDLAKRDLVATPQGYAALAELRSVAGDVQGGKLAMQRCSSMTKDKAVCAAGHSEAVQG
jgi:hypothetical protein